MLIKPEERIVEGIRIEKEWPITNGSKTGADSVSRRGRPTVWLDEREGGGECRVESMCLSWYRDNGWKGYHSEGGIVRTLVRITQVFPDHNSIMNTQED
jgi:Fanconi-associated nuclease 1